MTAGRAPSLDALITACPDLAELDVLLVAADTRGAPTAALTRIAEALLATGVRYTCCWGPDCERFHDCFDDAGHLLGVSNELMTTWHAKESLSDALFFAVHATLLHPDLREPRTVLIVAIGEVDSASPIERLLSAPSFRASA